MYVRHPNMSNHSYNPFMSAALLVDKLHVLPYHIRLDSVQIDYAPLTTVIVLDDVWKMQTCFC